MSRKAELQTEETAVASPLRRSTRKSSVNSQTPTVLTTKRISHTQNENDQVKNPKTRRASLSQENVEKDENIENKLAARGRKASITKEEPDKKPEPAKTRSRRSSAASEASKEEEPKPQTVTRRRTSSAAEEPTPTEAVKPVRTRRGSSSDKTIEEPPKKTTRATRSAAKEEEPKEEPVKRASRSRRNSVEKTEEVEVKKPATRGRRASIEEPKTEVEPKPVTLTPIKTRRRLSITENAINLESIEETESEVKNSSPVIKDAVVNLTPINSGKPEAKTNLNLSVIDESSFTEDTLDENKRDKEVATLRRSPRLSKSNSSSPSNTRRSTMEKNQSPEQEKKDESGKSTPKKLEFAEESLDSKDEVETVVDAVKEEEEEPEKQDEEQEKQEVEEEKQEEVEIKDENPAEDDKCNISMGSDGSFKFHLNTSIPSSRNESVQEKEDELNSSKSSNASDKENVDINTLASPSAKKLEEEDKQRIVDVTATLTDVNNEDKDTVQQEIVVARVSNVFRPKMKENSFMEPMEVDEDFSILEQGQELEKSSITQIADESFKDDEVQEMPVNKNLKVGNSVDKDNDSVDESFYLQLSVDPEENEDIQNVSQRVKVTVTENSPLKDVSKRSRSPSFMCIEPDKFGSRSPSPQSRRSKSPLSTLSVVRSKSKSPLPLEEKPTSTVMRRKSKSPTPKKELSTSNVTLRKSKSPIPPEEKLTSTVVRSKSRSPAPKEELSTSKVSLRKSKSPVPKEEKISAKANADKSDKVDEETVEKKLEDSVSTEDKNEDSNLVDEQEVRTKSNSPVPTEEEESIPTQEIEENEVHKNSKSPVLKEEEPIPVETVVNDLDSKEETEAHKNLKSPSPTEEEPTATQSIANEKDTIENVEVSRNLTSPLPKEEVTDQEKASAKSPAFTPMRVEENLEKKHDSPDYTTASPAAQNLRIEDIEVVVRRRSRSPEFRRKSKSPQRDGIEKISDLTEDTECQLETADDVKDASDEVDREIRAGCEELEDSAPQTSETDAVGEDTPEKSEVGDTNDVLQESVKSGPSEDYEFEIPSDEEEKDKTQAPEYDQSTVVSSFMATSQHISDVSTSVEMDTVIIASEKKENVPKTSEEEEIVPDKEEESCRIQDDAVSEDDTDKSEIKVSKKSKTFKRRSSLQYDLMTEDTSEISDSVKKVEESKISEEEKMSRDEEEEGGEFVRIQNDVSEEEANKSEIKVAKRKKGKKPKRRILEDKEIETVASNSKNVEEPKVSEEENMPPDEEEDKVPEDDAEKSTAELKSNAADGKPFKQGVSIGDDEVFKNDDEEELDYDNAVEDECFKEDKSDEQEEESPRKLKYRLKHKKLPVSSRKTSDQDEDSEDESSTVCSKKKLEDSEEDTGELIQTISSADSESPRKKLKAKKKSKRKEKKNTERNSTLDDEELEILESPKTESKSKKRLSKKRKSDGSSEDVTKSKKMKKLEKKKAKRDTESNEDNPEDETQTKKSPSSKLDDFLNQKIAEMNSEEESNVEDENPEEPNEFVYTMAEEGEEDTPSEDSNAIIDEGESINSTDTERGDSDDDYDDNDSFICNDEDEELLSGEEYDLGNEKKGKKKNSRIIQLDKIIRRKNKENVPVEKKRSRIITLSDSSEADEETKPVEVEEEEEEEKEVVKETSEIEEIIEIEEEKSDGDVIEEPKPPVPNLNVTSPGTEQRKRLASITIHENINVKDIEDTDITERITHLVGSFCNTMRKDEISEISMNVSIECTGKDEKILLEESVRERSRVSKRATSSNESTSEEEERHSKPPRRLSVSLCEPKKKTKKRKNKSSDEMEAKSKKRKTEKKKQKKLKKRRSFSEDDLMKQSFGLINQLITDVRNRPRRTIKPSTFMDTSWFTEEVNTNIRPSTSTFNKSEKEAYKAGKVHPKDFRSQMLNDPSRVRRVETKKLLKKKGVYL